VSSAYVHPFTYTRMTMSGRQEGAGANVLGMCIGTDPKLPYFVISAHYDHLGSVTARSIPAPTTTLRRGRDPGDRGVLPEDAVPSFLCFAAFDAEERGLQGARVFVENGPFPGSDRVERESRHGQPQRQAGDLRHRHIPLSRSESAARGRRKRAPITVLFGHDKPVAIAGGVEDWTNQSDHGPFHAAKIPFVYFGVEDHADYHKPTDTADKINRGFFIDVAETILDAVIALDRARN
jgi:hypothetical protein